MKTARKLILSGFFLILVFAVAMFSSASSIYALSAGAKGACVMNVSTGEVLFEKDADKKLPLASTTKILTAVVVIEKMELSKKVIVPKEAVGIEGSSIYLKEGEEIAVIDLLYGLMLRSGNDSAMALAIACSGSVEAFAKEMNDKAKEIGAIHSSFTNPHGLDDENHFTTARDLALISAYAMKNDVFKEIVSTKMHVVPQTNKSETRYFANKNKMLSSYDGACGVKTGYTKKTGRCLVSSAERDGQMLVCVVLSCPDMWNESKNLLDFGFNKLKKQ